MRRIIIVVTIISILINIAIYLRNRNLQTRLHEYEGSSLSLLAEHELPISDRYKTLSIVRGAAQKYPHGVFANALREFERTENIILNSLQKDSGVDSISGMCYVPEGHFIRGCDGRYKGEVVDTVLSSYYLDTYPVTNEQFVEFLNDSGNRIDHGVRWYQSKYGRIDSTANGFIVRTGFSDHPVVGVTWYGAVAYASTVGKRLPTESEWEKAARGMYGRWYPWGNTFHWSRANTACFWAKSNASDSKLVKMFEQGEIERVETTPVSKFAAGQSPYGCYDMAGNVWEWTSSWYVGRIRKHPRKINRGGNFLYGQSQAQTCYRGIGTPEKASVIVGFRCAKDAN